MCPSSSTPVDRSGEVTELEFDVSDPSYFFVGLSSAQACRVRLEEMIRRSDGTLVEFFTARDCPTDAVRERAGETATIDSARIIAERQYGITFRITLSGRCVVETIEGAGAIPRSITATDGAGCVTARVPQCVDVGDVVDSVLHRHPSLTLVARRRRDVSTPVFTHWGAREQIRTRLTDRQWEVLRTAYRKGYFRRPREHTGEEVADALGISSTTFSQHLRAALRNLLSVAVEERATADTGE